MRREPRNRFNQRDTGMSTRSDIYAPPDVYDMEYEGATIDITASRTP